MPNCPKCELPLNEDHAHRTYEEHDSCRNAAHEKKTCFLHGKVDCAHCELISKYETLTKEPSRG